MSKLKTVLIVVFIVIVLGMAACFFYKPLYYRLYTGDRITGSIRAFVDGVPVILNEDCFVSPEGMKIQVNDFDTSVSVKHGDYGAYSFGFFIQGVNKPVQITVYHYNWWSVTDFQLTAEASTEGNIVSFAIVSTCLDNNGEEITSSRNINIDTDNEDIMLIISGE